MQIETLIKKWEKMHMASTCYKALNFSGKQNEQSQHDT